MKVHVCLNGLLYDDENYFKKTIECHKSLFGGDTLFWISSWKSCKKDYINNYIDQDRQLWIDDIDVDYLNSISFPYTTQLKPLTHQKDPRFGIYSNWINAQKLINYVKGDDKDVICRSRTDLYFVLKNNHITYDNINAIKCYWCNFGNNDNIFMNDNIFWGSYKLMKEFFKYSKEYSDILLSNSWNPEAALRQHCRTISSLNVHDICETYGVIKNSNFISTMG